jgi:hypothetical protein
MQSSGILRRAALVRTDVSDACSASIIRGTRIVELRTLAVTSIVPSSTILVTLMKDVLLSLDTSVLTRATWRKTPEDGILQPLRGFHAIFLNMELNETNVDIYFGTFSASTIQDME